jgi:hypothetical protein
MSLYAKISDIQGSDCLLWNIAQASGRGFGSRTLLTPT